MEKHVIFHETDCPTCGADLTQPDGVNVHISAGDVQGDTASCVDPKDGHLIDTPDGVIAKGFHAGSSCGGCGEQLDELVSDGDGGLFAVAGSPPSRWYVRTLDSGEVWGPMSQTQAESMRDQLDDAVMFNEGIFEPKFSCSDEVEELIAKMRSVATAGIVIPHVAQELLAEAVDALVLLSRNEPKFCTSAEVEELVNRLRAGKGGRGPITQVTVIAMEKVMSEAADALILLSREKPKCTSAEVEELVRWLLERSPRCPEDEENHGSDWIRNMKAWDANLKKATDLLILLSREKPEPAVADALTPLVDTVVAETVVIAKDVSSVSM